MADHHHMLDAQVVNSELQYRQAVEIRVHHHIGDIAVYEQLAGQQVNDFVGGHSAVGAANPQVFGILLA